MRVLVALLALVSTASAADRSAPPSPGPVRPLVLPAEEHFTLSNGLGVYLVTQREVPVAEVVLVVRAGAAADPASRDGVALMSAAMLDEGAAGKSALELADEIDYLGAELETSATWDASTLRLRVPVARLQAGLAVLSDVALRPDFSSADLERLRMEALTDDLQSRDVAGSVGLRALYRALFGGAHRYGRPAAGDTAALAALGTSDLVTFHATHYRPRRSFLVVVGDVTAEILPALEKAFGGWTGEPGPLPAVAAPAELTSRSLVIVDKPGAVQSALRVGRVGPDRLAPGYHAAEVMNTLLGGSFTSRLNDNLREQHGYTYGARSRVERRRVGGTFLAATDVDGRVTAAALSEVLKELHLIRTPPPVEDLERARSYLALGFAGEFESTRQIASKLVERLVYDLPGDFYQSFVPTALAVNAADLERSGQSIVDPDRMAIVVVGDRQAIEKPLRDLGLGEPTLLSVEDVMGKAPKVQ